MHSENNKFFNVFLLCRPYTLFGILLLAILARVVSAGKLVLGFPLIFDLLFAGSFWLGIMYLGEYLHKDIDKRSPFSFLIPLIFFTISFFTIALRNYYALALFFLSIIAVFLYSSKAKNWLLSPIMFVFRGVIESSIFLSIILMNQAVISNTMLLLAASIYLLTISRNIVGDLRDSKFDKFTFPKRFGIALTKLLVLIFGIASIVLLPDLFSAIPIIISLLFLVLGLDFFFTHHFYVFSTYFLFLLLTAYFLGFNQLLLILAYFSLLFGFTYKLVPRKSNKDIPLY